MRGVRDVQVVALGEGGARPRRLHDEVVVEEPLEIRLNNVSVVVTMRTPGDDFDLAAGFLLSEGILRAAADIGTIGYCPDEDDPRLKNIINVTTADPDRTIESTRSTWANSSCGICGKTTIDAIRREIQPIQSSIEVNRAVLLALPERMREQQANFARTGGIHAAGLFDRDGNLLVIREDLGRHNAVDKAVGAALRSGVPTSETILMVSGRLGFEIAQKTVASGIPVVASVSAPSSLAIQLADELGVTAIGFVRGSSMNIYTHPQRVIHGISKHSA